MKLEECGEALAYEVAFWFQALEDPNYPLDELGSLCLKLSQGLRSLGIITLLAHADSDAFHHNLIRSALVREKFLQRLRDQGVDDQHHDCSGRFEPVLDAIAAGQWELAERIAAASPAVFRAGHEYEDDYCFAQLLFRLIAPDPPTDEMDALLEQYEQYLDGRPSARLEVCRALAHGDQPEFDQALEDLLAEIDLDIERQKTRGVLEEPVVVAQRRVSIEALALLRLAEKRSLASLPDYRYCPALARLPMNTPFPGE